MNKTIFNQILHDTLHHSPECEAAAYIDLQCATRLGTYFYPSIQPNHASDSEEMMKLIVNHVLESYNGKAFTKLADYFTYQYNLPPDKAYFHKHTLRGINHYCVYVRLKFNENHALAFVFNNKINRGLILREVDEFAKKIAEVAQKTDIPNPKLSDDEQILDGHAASNILQPPTPITDAQHPSEIAVLEQQISEEKQSKKDILSVLDNWLNKKS